MVKSTTRELMPFEGFTERPSRAPVPSSPPLTSFVSSETQVLVGEIAYKAYVHKHKGVRDKVSSRGDKKPSKVNCLRATVRYVETDFVTVHAMIGDDSVEFKISRELCSDEVAREGMPVSVTVDDRSHYSSLRVERREKSVERSDALKKRFAAMEAWISAAE